MHISEARVAIAFYASRFSKSDLDYLRTIALQQILPKCQRLAGWLICFADDERARRLLWRNGDLLEPYFPAFNPEDWTGDEIGEALLCCHILTRTAPSMELRDFASKVLMFFIATAASRLAPSEPDGKKPKPKPRRTPRR